MPTEQRIVLSIFLAAGIGLCPARGSTAEEEEPSPEVARHEGWAIGLDPGLVITGGLAVFQLLFAVIASYYVGSFTATLVSEGVLVDNLGSSPLPPRRPSGGRAHHGSERWQNQTRRRDGLPTRRPGGCRQIRSRGT